MILIFDLDGTVLDTFPLIRESFIATFKTHMPDYQYCEEELMSYFGPVLHDTFGKFSDDAKRVQEMVDTYRDFNLNNHDTFVSAFPGVSSGLKELKENDYVLTIMSNKMHDAVCLGLEVTGLLSLFEFIVGSNDVKKVKPDPEGINKILQHYQQTEAIMIGDTALDMQAAKNAGIISIGVTWSLATKSELLDSGADYIADNFNEVLQIIEEVHRNV